MSYRDRTDFDPTVGHAVKVSTTISERATMARDVMVEIGVMRNFGSMSPDAWAVLTPAEARELSDDLRRAATEAERKDPR